MRCDDAQTLLHAWADQELDPANSHIVASHMSQCPSCAASAQNLAKLSQAIKVRVTRYEIPSGLYERVAQQPDPRTKTHALSWGGRFKWGGIGAAVSLAACLVLFVVARPDEQYMTQQQLVMSHVHSLQEGHLTDVLSTDQHTVKPWFNGKSDISPPVVDLASDGFPLVGGRLDYIGDHPAAVLVYHVNNHFINLFIWHQDHAPLDLGRYPKVQGYHMRHWRDDDLQFWAVSDVNDEKLMDFERAFTAHQ